MQEQMNNFKVHVIPQSVFYKSYRDVIIDIDEGIIFRRACILVCLLVPKKYRIFFEPGHLAFCQDVEGKEGMGAFEQYQSAE